MLYATSRRFLEVFGLDSLKGLPTLRELDELAREQGLIKSADDEAADAAESVDLEESNREGTEESESDRVLAVGESADLSGVAEPGEEAVIESALHLVSDSDPVAESDAEVVGADDFAADDESSVT